MGELPFSEHVEELRQRIFLIVGIILLFTCFAFVEVKSLVKILELPINNVKFFSIITGRIFYFNNKNSLLYWLTFFKPICNWSINFIWFRVSFFVLYVSPSRIKLFLNYSEEVLEPFLSFDQYFEFILVLFYSTGLAFQIPIIQILVGLLNIVSPKQMLGAWRYVILISTILGAILTPSTDPLTQLLLSFAIILLYISGLGILFLIKN